MPLKSSLPFIAVVVWLLSVPMEGFLLSPLGLGHSLLFFLVPHALTFLFIGTICPPRLIRPLSIVGAVVAAGVTLLLQYFPDAVPLLLGFAGGGAAFPIVSAAACLKRSPSPGAAAAFGLATANLLLLFFSFAPLSDGIKLHLAAVLLLVPMLAPAEVESQGNGESNLALFLPIIFVFQVVSGLMYGTLYGHYASTALLPGAEIIFYVIALWGGLLILRRRREGLLVMAIVTAMFAFSLYLLPGIVPVNAAMFAIQGAAGLFDLYLIALLLTQRETIQAFGRGLAVNCGGITLGKLISFAIGDASQLVVAAANLVLALSVLLLYILIQRSREQLPHIEPESPSIESPSLPEDVCVPPSGPLVLQPALRKRFSPQEKSVLECIARGMTFRDVAGELGISESSVKTYMKRIYDKMNVSGKEELLVKLEEHQLAWVAKNKGTGIQ